MGRLRRYSRTTVARFAFAKDYARRRRRLPWGLSFEEFRELLSRPCIYCGGPLNETGVGLDLLDVALGFIPSNVKPCCGPCLAMRRTLTLAEVRLVLSHRKAAA